MTRPGTQFRTKLVFSRNLTKWSWKLIDDFGAEVGKGSNCATKVEAKSNGEACRDAFKADMESRSESLSKKAPGRNGFAFVLGVRVHKRRPIRRKPSGELNGSAVLTTDYVREIRARLAGGELTSAIASEFGVSATAIRDIKSLKTWPHVK